MSDMNPYKGRLTPHQRAEIDLLLSEGVSVRGAAKQLDLSYGQVRGFVEWHQNLQGDIQPPHSPKMLVFDIENAPFKIWAWDLWKTNAIAVDQDWYLLSFSYAWYDLRTDEIGDIGFVSIYQDPAFVAGSDDDRYVIERLWKLLDEADIVIGQNSKSFDVKKFNARAVIHGYGPPQPYQQIDTKTAASEVGRFGSNSLKHLARQLGIALKEENRGWPLWEGCIEGDPASWAEMESYNKADVLATSELYSRLRPWMTSRQHPNLGLYITAEGKVCTTCGNKEKEEGGEGFQYRGFQVTNASKFPQVLCNKCGKYSREYSRVPQRTSQPESVVDLR